MKETNERYHPIFDVFEEIQTLKIPAKFKDLVVNNNSGIQWVAFISPHDYHFFDSIAVEFLKKIR